MTLDQTTITLITGFGIILSQMYQQSRQRKWDKEDRLRVAKELAAATLAQTTALAAKVTHAAAEVADTVAGEAAAMTQQLDRAHVEVKAIGEHLIAAVAENTAITQGGAVAAREAYHEANSVNLKIATLGLEHNALLVEAAAVGPRVDRIVTVDGVRYNRRKDDPHP